MVADDRDSGMRLVGGCDVLTTGLRAGNSRELTTGLGSDGGERANARRGEPSCTKTRLRSNSGKFLI